MITTGFIITVIIIAWLLMRMDCGTHSYRSMNSRFHKDINTERYTVCFYGGEWNKMIVESRRFHEKVDVTSALLGMQRQGYKEEKIDEKILALLLEFIVKRYDLPPKSNPDDTLDAYWNYQRALILTNIKIKRREE